MTARLGTLVGVSLSSDTADFYVAGGTLRADAPSYIPRQADEDLYNALSKGEFCYVLTSRQMGKSSLMARTAQRLRDDGVTPFILDLTAVGQNVTLEQWYAGLLSRLGRSVDLEDELEDFWIDHEHRGPMQRWVDAIEQVIFPRISGPMVVFVDELDLVQSLAFSTNEFFAGIRECYTRRTEDDAFQRLTFCLLGVATSSALIDDARVTPFNIGQRIELTDFTEKEARRLADGLECESDVSAALIARVLHWTGGHPYLTQRLSQELARDPSVTDASDVDRLCAGLFFSERAQEQDSNLQFVRNQMLGRDEVDPATLLTLYRDVWAGKSVPYDETNPAVDVLQLSGVARVADGHMRVRNRIYQHVFDASWTRENMPHAEIRRQRAAYRRGVLRTGGLAAAVLIVVTALAMYAVAQKETAQDIAYQRAEESARATLARAVQLLRDGDSTGLLQLVEARRVAPEGSAIASVVERTWDGWQRGYEGRLISVIDHPSATQAEFSPNGSTIIVGSMYGQAALYDVATGQRVGPAFGKGQSEAVAYSADGARVATGGPDGIVRVWDARTHELVAECVGEGRYWDVEFSADSALVAAASVSARHAQIWRADTGEPLGPPLDAGSYAFAVAFSPDAKHLATGAGSGLARIRNVDTGAQVGPDIQQGGIVFGVDFAPDGTWVATTGALRGEAAVLAVQFWTVPDGKSMRPPMRTALVGSGGLRLSPDGTLVALSSHGNAAHVYSLATGDLLGAPLVHEDTVSSVSFGPRGDVLATVSRTGVVRVWQLRAFAEPDRTFQHQLDVSQVAFDAQSRMATMGESVVNVWDWRSGARVAGPLVHPESLFVVDIAPKGDRVAAASRGSTVYRDGASRGGTVYMWDVSSAEQTIAPIAHEERIVDVEFHPDGSVLAIATYGGAFLWDPDTGELMAPVIHEGEFTYGVAFDRAGSRLAVGTADRVEVWSLPPGDAPEAVILVPLAAYRCAFLPDGRHLAVATQHNEVRVYDVATGAVVGKSFAQGGTGYYVALSPDGKTLATRGWEPFQLWDFETRTPIGMELATKPGWRNVAFTPDGRAVAHASGRQLGVVEMWDVPRSGHSLREMEVATWRALGSKLDEDGARRPMSGEQWRALPPVDAQTTRN
jgi:WD40 repeat protein